ncbi:MAG: sigma-54 dependent transcriptional regulator [Pseudomonadota bacterium]
MTAAATAPDTDTDRPRVLFVDDEEVMRVSYAQVLDLAGFEVQVACDGESALARAAQWAPSVVVSDVRMPGMDGLALMRALHSRDPGLPVALITGHGDITMAVDAMRAGACDFIEKPFIAERLVELVRRASAQRRLEQENQRLRAALQEATGIGRFILGQSASMRALRQLITQIADTRADVLIHGETGSGKEMVARALHEFSARRDKPFVALNCAALPETVFESELFGYEPGAFTGAVKRRIGKIEYASGGTLFLDELEGMPLSMQVKLLRVLQERRIERLGSNTSVAVDVRVIAATKEDLLLLAKHERFRADLVYRLNVVNLSLPPLRERRQDIPLLFQQFLIESADKYGCSAPTPEPGLVRHLMAQDWPGNVRELRNVAERFVLGVPVLPSAEDAASGEQTLAEQVDAFERVLIEGALWRSGRNVSSAANTLGVPRKTLYDKLKRHGIALRDIQDE